MIQVNLSEFKARMSEFVQRLKRGETVTLCERNVPIAEIQPLPQVKRGKRIFGLHRGKFQVNDEVWAPLSDEELRELFGDAF